MDNFTVPVVHHDLACASRTKQQTMHRVRQPFIAHPCTSSKKAMHTVPAAWLSQQSDSPRRQGWLWGQSGRFSPFVPHDARKVPLGFHANCTLPAPCVRSEAWNSTFILMLSSATIHADATATLLAALWHVRESPLRPPHRETAEFKQRHVAMSGITPFVRVPGEGWPYADYNTDRGRKEALPADACWLLVESYDGAFDEEGR